jgi:hypothetical protein
MAPFILQMGLVMMSGREPSSVSRAACFNSRPLFPLYDLKSFSKKNIWWVSFMPDSVRMLWTLVLLLRVEASSNIDLS